MYFSTEKEVWKDVKGYEGYYKISNTGKVKSLTRRLWNGVGYFTKPEAILKPNPQVSGYLNVHLYKNKKRRPFAIHRLVAKHFIGFPKNEEHVNHKDGDKTNNHIENLEWVTRKENTRHAMETGLWNPKAIKGTYGIEVKQYDLDGRYLKSYPSASIAGEQFSKHASSAISKVCKDERKTAYGYKWEYA